MSTFLWFLATVELSLVGTGAGGVLVVDFATMVYHVTVTVDSVHAIGTFATATLTLLLLLCF